jgi:nitronate monooxygenase
MDILKMKELKIGDLIARLPIIQGGMGIGVSLSGLAAAVANKGGIGVISAAGIGMFEYDFRSDYLTANIRALQNEIRKAREKTKGILGVNIMVAMSNFAEMVTTAIDEGIDIIFSGAGLPLNLPGFLKKSSTTKLVPIVSSSRAANIITKKWVEKFDHVPDAIVVEGPMAGGHLGFKLDQIDDPLFSLENLTSDVMAMAKDYSERLGVRIPVIAAGGVYTGGDIYELMQAGLSGVQMATRFVTTIECDASNEFKQTYLSSKKEDIVIIKSPVGMPGRAIMNKFTQDTQSGGRKPFKCPYHCIITCDYMKSPYCIALALMNAKKGNLNNGFAFAGSNAYRATGIISVAKLLEDIENEYSQAVLEDTCMENVI